MLRFVVMVVSKKIYLELNSMVKICKTCSKNERFKWRTECLKCIQEKEYNKAKERARKEKAKERINIRLSWVDEEDRLQLREKIKETVWPYLKNKQIGIKVSRGKSNSELQKLEKKADEKWSIAVKLNYGNKCAYSGSIEDLNAHHIESRVHRSTRWDIDCGICLSATHHTFSSEFSAHKTPAKFRDWLIETKWQQFVDELHMKSRQIVKITPEFVKEKIKILEEFIANNS